MTEETTTPMDSSDRPVASRGLSAATKIREHEVAKLNHLVDGIDLLSELDRLGQVRIIELQARNIRRAVVAEARAAGHSWAEIGPCVGLSADEAQHRFSRKATAAS